MSNIFSLILHIDKVLPPLAQQFSGWIYLILFFVIFSETGLVFMFFLPGDSLLFVAGSLAGLGLLELDLLLITCSIAAILGDSLNYTLGFNFGKAFLKKMPFIKENHIQKTERFYEQYGPKTIVLCRYIPVVRTFAPFIAGVVRMKYNIFFSYNVIGALIWVLSLVISGYFFGQLAWVQSHMSQVTIFIIILSFLPLILDFLKKKKHH